MTDYLWLAGHLGFSHAGTLEMSALIARQEVRDMCRADRCQAYDRRWSCPPGCGSLEETAAKMAAFQRGILVQTTGTMEDDFDLDSIRRTREAHQSRFTSFADLIRLDHPEALPLGAGACSICPSCAYPDRPCRFPGRMHASMEAFGLWVSDVCLRSGMEYNYGPHTITFTSCVLYRDPEEPEA